MEKNGARKGRINERELVSSVGIFHGHEASSSFAFEIN
jgi:hypothetical protein